MKKTIFAYGSNLVLEQMTRRCPSAKVLSTAQLRDVRLDFAGYSSSRRGAVATLSVRKGAAVDGVLYRLTESDLLALDKHEGAPSFYVRAQTVAVTEARQLVPTHVYVLAAAERSYWPSAHYLSLVREGYGQWGFSKGPIRRALARLERPLLLDLIDRSVIDT